MNFVHFSKASKIQVSTFVYSARWGVSFVIHASTAMHFLILYSIDKNQRLPLLCRIVVCTIEASGCIFEFDFTIICIAINIDRLW